MEFSALLDRCHVARRSASCRQLRRGADLNINSTEPKCFMHQASKLGRLSPRGAEHEMRGEPYSQPVFLDVPEVELSDLHKQHGWCEGGKRRPSALNNRV